MWNYWNSSWKKVFNESQQVKYLISKCLNVEAGAVWTGKFWKVFTDVEMKKTMSTQMKKSFTELEMKPNFSKDVSSKNEESNFCDKFVVFFELVN